MFLMSEPLKNMICALLFIFENVQKQFLHIAWVVVIVFCFIHPTPHLLDLGFLGSLGSWILGFWEFGILGFLDSGILGAWGALAS